MTYQEDQKFLESIQEVKNYGFHVNENFLHLLYKDLNLYYQSKEVPEYPVWLILRELGGSKYIPVKKIFDPFSNDISTTVLEHYFFETLDNIKYNTISRILSEIHRISGNNFACTILHESEWDEAKETSVTIRFKVLEKHFELTHKEELGIGTLTDMFLRNQLLPALKGSIIKGHLLYSFDDNSITFIYFQCNNYFLKFTEEFNYNNMYRKI